MFPGRPGEGGAVTPDLASLPGQGPAGRVGQALLAADICLMGSGGRRKIRVL